MSEIDLISYLLVFALCVVFSGFTVERKSNMFSILTMTFWFMLAICHLGVASESTFISLAYLFMGLGFVFFIYGVALTFSNFTEKKRREEWEVQ